MTTTFVLIRHGETPWNREGRLMGITDIPLTDEGKRQAVRLATHLKDYPFDVLFASPLRRTMQTAKTIHRYHRGIPLVSNVKLRERNFGAAEGLTYENANKRHPELSYAESWKYLYFRPHRGESLIEVQKRSEEFLAKTLVRYEGTQIGIVSHGTFLRVLAYTMLEIPLTHFVDLHMDNAAVTILQKHSNHGPLLHVVNYTHHLTDR